LNKKKTSYIMILAIISSFMFSCGGNKQVKTIKKEKLIEKKVKENLPNLVFLALKNNDLKLLKKEIMTLERYVELAKIMPKEADGKEVSKEHLIKAAERAEFSVSNSFNMIVKILTKSGFSLKNSKLDSIKVQVRRGTTELKDYLDTNKDQRLDIFIIISDGMKKVVIKLDDCFIMDSKRYLGDGLRVMEVEGFKVITD